MKSEPCFIPPVQLKPFTSFIAEKLFTVISNLKIFFSIDMDMLNLLTLGIVFKIVSKGALFLREHSDYS